MIELSPVLAILFYLVLTLSTLLIVWGWHHYKTLQKKIILSEKELCVCEYCHFAYLDKIDKKITQCPQCNSYNDHI